MSSREWVNDRERVCVCVRENEREEREEIEERERREEGWGGTE